MNERIKELAERAGLKLDNLPDDVYIPLEQFAELIIKECAEQVDWILAEGGKTQGDLIKQHFGVE